MIPGYKSVHEFAIKTGQYPSVVKRQMLQGFCKLKPLDGRYKHPLYSTWKSMVDRCHNTTSDNYHKYGARGIQVCILWRSDFWSYVNGIESLGPKPTPQHTLDRIDNSKGYEPDNIRWADKTTQVINQRVARNNTSGFRGLSFNPITRMWSVSVTRRGKYLYRKAFKCKLDALTALINIRRDLQEI